jgi:hypothetical protein
LRNLIGDVVLGVKQKITGPILPEGDW